MVASTDTWIRYAKGVSDHGDYIYTYRDNRRATLGETNMNYLQFKQEWINRRIDYDNVYAYQCVDLILEYLKEVYNIPTGVWGNAIDYAINPTLTFSKNFYRVDTGSQGDIVVLNGLSGNPFGHIGLFDHQDSNGIWMLEQNMLGSGSGEGKNAIGVYRAIPLNRVNKIYRNKGKGTTPTPAPARNTVFLPASAGPWHLYNYGSSYTPSDVRAVKGILRPDIFPPGLPYKIEAWIGNYAVVIQTQDFGRGVVWVKNTGAVIK